MKDQKSFVFFLMGNITKDLGTSGNNPREWGKYDVGEEDTITGTMWAEQ